MSASPQPLSTPSPDQLSPSNAAARNRRARLGQRLFASATVIAMLALLLLLYNIASETVGLVAVEYENDPSTLADRPLAELSKDELTAILQSNVSAGLFRRLERDMPFAERSQADVLALVQERVVEEKVIATYSLGESLFQRPAIEEEVRTKYPDGRLQWKSWLTPSFLTRTMASEAWLGGVRTALLGSLWMIAITMLLALPVGLGAAIYLEEYATDNLINRLIQTNINNLAGVPSIIYGMLGLAIFVRALSPLTSGALFGVEGGNGRHYSFRLADHGPACFAHHHYQCPGSHSGRAQLVTTGQLWARGNQVANHLASRAAYGPAKHSDGHHPGHVACHRRNCPTDCGGGLNLHRHQPIGSLFQLHCAPDPGVQLVQGGARRVP